MRRTQVIVTLALVLALSTGCAYSVGKKGLQASAGIASANAEEEVTSQGFSEGGVQVMTQAITAVGNLAISVLRFVTPAGLAGPAPAIGVPDHSHDETAE